MGAPGEKAEKRKILLDNFWNKMELSQLQEQVTVLESESRLELNRFTASPAIQENLPLAVQLLEYSREKSPLQPWVHLKLAQINVILGNVSEADGCIERVLAVAPMNPRFRKMAGLYYFQSNRPEIAVKQFRRQLELQPGEFGPTVEIAGGLSNRSIDTYSIQCN